MCQSFKIATKVYSDWIKTNNCLIGFYANVIGKNFTKEEQLLKIEKFISENQLPVEIENEDHPTRFKIRILK